MSYLRFVALLTVAAVTGCSELSPFTGLGGPDDLADTADEIRAAMENDLNVRAWYELKNEGTPEVSLKSSLEVTNNGERQIRGNGGAYLWLIRVYASPERSGDPIWKWEQLTEGEQIDFVGTISRALSLNPGQRKVYEMPAIWLSDILGDHPPGTYYFSYRLVLTDPEFEYVVHHGGEAELPNPNHRP